MVYGGKAKANIGVPLFKLDNIYFLEDVIISSGLYVSMVR